MLRTQTGYLRVTKAALTDHAAEKGLEVRGRITTELVRFKDRFGPTLCELDDWVKSAHPHIYEALRPQTNCTCEIESVEGDKLHLVLSKLLVHRDEKRSGIMLYILGEETARVTLVYTSLSQGIWRVAPYGIWGRHFGKTDNEDKLNLPVSVHELLDSFADFTKTHQGLSYEGSFDLTVLQPEFIKAREMCITTRCPQKFEERDLSGAVIDDRKHFEGPWVSWPIHGQIKRVSFLSQDGRYRYHFLISPLGFSLASAEERSPFSKYGLRPLPEFTAKLIAPLIEYDVQIKDPIAHVEGYYYAPRPMTLLDRMQSGPVNIMTRDALIVLHDTYSRGLKKLEVEGRTTDLHTVLADAWNSDIMKVLFHMQ
jgi:hypothetical protein